MLGWGAAGGRSGRRRFFAWLGLGALTLGSGGALGLLSCRDGGGDTIPGRRGARAARRSAGPEGLAADTGAKQYPGAELVALPQPTTEAAMATVQAIRTRRSQRAFKDRPLTLQELSNLLYYGGGITAPQGSGRGLRAAPSAGALYPIEIYAVVRQVEGLRQGIYHYRFADHALELVKEGDLLAALAQACLSQMWLSRGAAALVLTAVFQRTVAKYGDRGHRYVLLDCGHLSENVYLAATSMGLGACAVGAFDDDQVNALLGLDGEQESALLVLPVGAV